MTRASRFRSDLNLTSWGRVLRAPHEVARPRFRDELTGLFDGAVKPGLDRLAIGLGRSYGESGLNGDHAVIDMTRLDRFTALDTTSGVVRAEAGLTLSAVARKVVPLGFFLPTTPGTRFVTLGGAVANDVHGKNHHRAGTFGTSVRRLGLLRSDGTRLKLSADENGDLFAATIGGLGLTGVIEWVEFQLTRIPSACIDQETIVFGNVDEFFALASESVASHEHTVAWVDCTATGADLGRGIFSRGNWAVTGGLKPHAERPKIQVPFTAPGFALNPLTLRAFNAGYFAYSAWRAGASTTPYASHFYPLDAIADWNKLYGPKGFYQYQAVLPHDVARDAVRAMLEIIAASGQGSLLAVLKTFGELRSPGLMSFPRPGATLALDFRNRGSATLKILSQLDTIVREAGGALYPAKDGRMPVEMFRASFPNWERMTEFKDPMINSTFWRRMTA